jgi:hypothetical protein
VSGELAANLIIVLGEIDHYTTDLGVNRPVVGRTGKLEIGDGRQYRSSIKIVCIEGLKRILVVFTGREVVGENKANDPKPRLTRGWMNHFSLTDILFLILVPQAAA